MAKSFIYDSVGLVDSTLTKGNYVNGSGVWTSGSTINAKENTVDNSIGSSSTWAGALGVFKCGLRFDLGSAKSVGFMMIYFNDSTTADVKVYSSSSASTGYGALGTILTPSKGWSNLTLSGSYRYWVVQVEDTVTFVDAKINEIILGTKYNFEQEVSSGGQLGADFGVLTHQSIGGNDFSTKVHNPKKIWQYSFEGLTSSIKTNLEGIRDTVERNLYSFVYLDDAGDYTYVRFDDNALNFKNVNGNRFSTSFKLIEQIG